MLPDVAVLPPTCLDCGDYGFDSPGLQIGGLLISEWDATNREYANLAATKAAGEVFDLSDPAVAVAVNDRGVISDYWTFGGVANGGAYSDQMWHAQALAGMGHGGSDEDRTLWLSQTPRTEGAAWPSARAGATLAVRGAVSGGGMVIEPGPVRDGFLSGTGGGPEDGQGLPIGLLLVGGRGPNARLADVWFYDAGLWYQVDVLPDAAGGLSDSSAVLAERKLWLFGGLTDAGVTDGLWSVDLDSGRAERVEKTGAWPSARRGAAVTFDAVRRRLVAFGGIDASGAPRSDVWAFSLAANAWIRLAADCTGNSCPAVTGKERTVVDATRNELTVVADPAGPDADVLAWTMAEGVWQTTKELSTIPDQEDCDGDGMNDLGWGARCGSGSNGFPDSGRRRCDAVAAEATCRLPAAPAVELTGYSIPGLRAVAAGDGRVVALTERRLQVLSIQPGGILAIERSVTLPRDAYDVALWRGLALVADADGLLVVRTADGTTVGAVDTCGKARRVFVDGKRAVVLGLRSIVVASLDETAPPVGEQDLQIYPGGHGDLVVVEESRCSRFYGIIDVVCDISGACPWSRRLPAAMEGHRLFVNQLIRTYELDLSGSPASLPAVVSDFRTGWLGAIAYESPYLYTNGLRGGSAVYDGRSDPPWEYSGGHDVSLWVRGTAGASGYRFLADGDVLRVAAEQ